MPLRLLELTLADAEGEGLRERLEGLPVVDLWTAESADGAGWVRVVVDARHVEAVSDVLVEHFGSREGFRLTVLTLEATLPQVEEPADDDEPAAETEAGEPELQRISREELYEDLSAGSRLSSIYAVMVALSTLVAAVGLIRGDVAIIIGAMVIAPLLRPNIALSLAAILGDSKLARRSLKTVGVGVALAVGLSILLGTVLRVDPSVGELATRTRVSVSDIVIALSAGAAGTLAFTSGVPAVVVGVMVAVALLPPLVAAGLLAGAGHGMPAARALLLLLTNLTCINLAAIATFFLQRVRPRSWWEEDQAKRATRLATAIWIAMLVVLLGLILLARETT